MIKCFCTSVNGSNRLLTSYGRYAVAAKTSMSHSTLQASSLHHKQRREISKRSQVLASAAMCEQHPIFSSAQCSLGTPAAGKLHPLLQSHDQRPRQSSYTPDRAPGMADPMPPIRRSLYILCCHAHRASSGCQQRSRPCTQGRRQRSGLPPPARKCPEPLVGS